MNEGHQAQVSTTRSMDVSAISIVLILGILALALLLATPATALALDRYEVDDARTTIPGTEPNAGPLYRDIDPYGDIDWIELPVEAGRTYVIEVLPDEDEWFDSKLDVFMSGSTVALASDDDGGINLLSRVVVTAQTDALWHVRVTGYSYYTLGSYSLNVYEIAPTTLTGIVRGVAEIPLPNTQVTVYSMDTYAWDQVAQVTTNESGRYSFTLSPGTYRLGYVLEGGQYLQEYYSNASTLETAQSLALAANQTTTLEDVSLVRWNRVRGAVYNWNGGQALSNVSIAAYRMTSGRWDAFSWTSTDLDGSWSMPLAQGTYKFKYTDNTGASIDMFHPAALTLDAATEVVVGADPLTLEARLASRATVSGAVTDAETGQPIANAAVSLMAKVGDTYQTVGSATSAADGTYSIAYRTGSYALWVAGPGSDYCPAYHDGSMDRAQVQEFSVSPAGASMPVRLTAAAYLIGTVVDSPAGAPLAGATVTALRLVGDEWIAAGTTVTRNDGGYTLTGVCAGTYRIRATAPGNELGVAYWGGATVADAQTVTVASRGLATGLDIRVNTDFAAPVTTSDAYRFLVAPAVVTLKATDESPIADTFNRVNGGEWISGNVIELAVGTHTLEYYSVDINGYAEEPKTESVTVRVSSLSIQAVAGANRFATAVEVSRKAFPAGADTIIAVTGASWPDGLSAASLAGAVDAPILLVDESGVPGVVAAEIVRLNPSKIIIIGGVNAVNADAHEFFVGFAGAANVQRISGSNRFETARLVAEETLAQLKRDGVTWDGKYVLASGVSFPDVLAASPLAARMAWPVLLTNTDALPEPTALFLEQHSGAKAIIAGGPAAVSETTARQAAALTNASTTRISGSNRYATAVALAEYARDNGILDFSSMAVATGQNFPDALTVSALQNKVGSVLLLTPSGQIDAGVAEILDSLSSNSYHEITFVGGPSAITPAVRNQLVGHLAR